MNEDKLKEADHYIPFRDVNPFPDQTPRNILEREFYVGNFTDVVNYREIHPIFFAQPTCPHSFRAALKTFGMFRFKRLIWRVIYQGNPFQYGAVFLTACPKTKHRNVTGTLDPGWYSHNDVIMLDLSTQQEAEIAIDWPFCVNWLYTAGLSDTTQADFITSVLALRMVSTGLETLDSSTTTKIDMKVYIRLEGVEAAQPQSYVDDAIGESQSSTELLPPAWQNPTVSPVMANAIGGVLGTTGLAMFSSMFGSKIPPPPASSVPEFVMGLGSEPEKAEEKVVQDRVVQDIFGSVNYPQKSPVLASGSVVNQASLNMSVIDYCKKPSFVGVFSCVSGTTVSEQVAPTAFDTQQVYCDRILLMSKFFRFWRGSINYTFAFVSSPLISARALIQLKWSTAAAPVGDVISKVVTIRGTTVVNVTVPYLRSIPWSPVLGSTSAAPYVVVEMLNVETTMGDHTPKVHLHVWRSAGPDFMFSSIREPQSTYVPPPPPPSERRVNSQSALETKLRRLRVIDEEIGESQSTLKSMVFTDYIGASGPTPTFRTDEDLSFANLLSRWSIRGGTVMSETPPIFQSGPNMYQNSNIDLISTLFLYWKGQTRRKNFYSFPNDHVAKPGSYLFVKMEPFAPMGNNLNLQDSERLLDGMAVASPDLTQVLEYTVPYLSTTEWQWIQQYSPPTSYFPHLAVVADVQVGNYDDEAGLRKVAVAAGNDFSFRYDMPPPFVLNWYVI